MIKNRVKKLELKVKDKIARDEDIVVRVKMTYTPRPGDPRPPEIIDEKTYHFNKKTRTKPMIILDD